MRRTTLATTPRRQWPALWNRAGHYIFVMWFLSSFFLAYSQRSETGCLPYFYTWCGLSANLECTSEMCCTRLAENTGRKNDAKLTQKSPSAHHRTTLSGCIFATKACIDNRKKLLNSNISSMCLHNMANFGSLTAEIGSGVPRQISTAFASCLRYCSDVAHRRTTKLCMMFGRLLS